MDFELTHFNSQIRPNDVEEVGGNHDNYMVCLYSSLFTVVLFSTPCKKYYYTMFLFPMDGIPSVGRVVFFLYACVTYKSFGT